MVSMFDCGVRGPRFESHCSRLFFATAAAMCGLGHGLCTFAAVHKSTQPGIPLGSLNRVPVSAGVRAGMSALPGGRQHCDLMACEFP